MSDESHNISAMENAGLTEWRTNYTMSRQLPANYAPVTIVRMLL